MIFKKLIGVYGMWLDDSFVSMVGLNEAVMRRYIEKQEYEERGQACLG
jgi:energy-converting hydrogenase Eha subunit A